MSAGMLHEKDRKSGRLRPLLVVALLLTTLALIAAACGGGDDSGSPEGEADGAVPAGASLIPGDVFFYGVANTDFDSDQWQSAQALLEKFPGGQDLLQQAVDSLSSEGLDFETDIKPALGPEVHLAILDLPIESGVDPTIAVLTNPADPAKLDALLEQSNGDEPVWRVVDGWYILADTQAIIDRVVNGARTASLADNETFTDLFGKISGSAVVRAYVSGAAVSALIESAAAGQEQVGDVLGDLSCLGPVAFEGAALAAVAVTDGVKLDAIVRPAGTAETSAYEARVPDSVPGPVIAYLSFQNLRTTLEACLDSVARANPDLDTQIGQLESLLGITIADDILPWFEGEHAVYVRPATPTPEVSVVLSPDDPETAEETLNQLIALATLSGDPRIERGELEVGDISAKTLTVGGVVILFAAVDGQLVFTTSRDGLEDFGRGPALVDDPQFAEARDAAGMPNETAGFVYLDFSQVWDLLSLIPQVSVDADQLTQVEPLRDLLFYSTIDGGDARLTGLIRIE